MGMVHMTLTLELAAFTVREDAEPALLAERPEMLAALRRAFLISPSRRGCGTSRSRMRNCSGFDALATGADHHRPR
jgi:hypothetical protein